MDWALPWLLMYKRGKSAHPPDNVNHYRHQFIMNVWYIYYYMAYISLTNWQLNLTVDSPFRKMRKHFPVPKTLIAVGIHLSTYSSQNFWNEGFKVFQSLEHDLFSHRNKKNWMHFDHLPNHRSWLMTNQTWIVCSW